MGKPLGGYPPGMTTTGREATRPLRDPLLSPTVLRERAPQPARSVVWLDLLRIAAILAVVAIHTVSGVTRGVRVPLLSTSWWVGATIDAASLWCVPVFVMISGSLLLNPGREQRVGDFYRRRMERIGVPLVFWTAVYLVFRDAFLGDDLSVGRAAHDVAAGQPFMQMYFLFAIAGLYVATPPLRRLLRSCDDRQWAMAALGALAFAVLDSMLHDLAHAGGANAATRWLEWLGYFIAGGLLRRVELPRWTVPVAALAFVGSVAATLGGSAALAAHYGWQLPAYYLFAYQSPTVVVASVAVFCLARVLGERAALRPRRGVAVVARATFGVFLVHPLLLIPYLRLVGIPGSPGGIALAVPLIVLGVVAASTVVTLLMERIPLVRRLV